MNFFEHQDRARRNTKWLVFLYALAMFLTTAIVYAVVVGALVAAQNGSQNESGQSFDNTFLVDPAFHGTLLLMTLVVVGGVVGCATLYKTVSLSAHGGVGIATQLGGREVASDTRDPSEKRLYNVVEEMAIASGIPVPHVFILDGESGINAFAAGFTTQNAVVAVTRGTLDQLSRDELQGVIAHEFSHILNGDMRINLRLLGVLFGLEVLALIGWGVIRVMATSSRGSNKKDGGAALVFLVVGLALLIGGAIGMFFSCLIKAAISRQREFLADASAVQFTRYPAGIAGALNRIKTFTNGSKVEATNALEMSHFFFGSISGWSFGSLWATHPPLDERIRRILATPSGAVMTLEESRNQKRRDDETSQDNSQNKKREKNDARSPADRVMGRIGKMNWHHLAYLASMMESLPTPLRDASHESESATVLTLAILIESNSDETLLPFVRTSLGDEVVKRVNDLRNSLKSVAPETYVPLVQSALAAMRKLPPERYRAYRKCVEDIIQHDNRVTLFEYTLRGLLLRDLDVFFGCAERVQVAYHSVQAIAVPAATALSVIARRGNDDESSAETAFAEAMNVLSIQNFSVLPNEACSFVAFAEAMDKLAAASPPVMQRFVEAVTTCIASDGKVTPHETELLRATCAMLGCPMPSGM
ncbi:MAG: M48 family metallopeptidase [Thermoguttaceae bacterium]